MPKGSILGIDAANLLRGGGRTHLIELLRAADPASHGFREVVIWGRRSTLSLLDDRPWLRKVSPAWLDAGLGRRAAWQTLCLDREARAAGCDLLFIPGGSSTGRFRPSVLMSQNLLPFEPSEIRRYTLSARAAKLTALRFVQAWSFRRCDGLVFLTRYGQQVVARQVSNLPESVVIPHGLHQRFLAPPRPQLPISAYGAAKPLRLLYVSIVDQYKHQWQVVEAVARLRQRTGWPLALDLVGPAYPRSLKRLQRSIHQHDPDGGWLAYHGALPYDQLHAIYARSDLALWASSCETFGLILLEAMGAGLPVASSHHPVMREILGDGGLYFDPEQPESIAQSMEELIVSPALRARLAAAAFERAQQFTWQRCADATFSFLAAVCAAKGSKVGLPKAPFLPAETEV